MTSVFDLYAAFFRRILAHGDTEQLREITSLFSRGKRCKPQANPSLRIMLESRNYERRLCSIPIGLTRI